MIEFDDEQARKALDIELEKCYNNRFNAARAYYYNIRSTKYYKLI